MKAIRLFLSATALVASALSASAQLVGLGAAPTLSPAGRALIYEFEVGGFGRLPNRGRPDWPGFASGVTVGIGYDCGYNSALAIRTDWQELAGAYRLAETAGITGQRARFRAAALSDIIVQWDLASEVFDSTTLAKFHGMTARAFPGFSGLRPNAQAALVSLVFNRGPSMIGDRRAEMREIRELVLRRDYAGIADAIRRMKRWWRGTDIQAGMFRRRDAEAALVMTP